MTISDKLKDHILESIGEGVFTVDKDFRINFFNHAAEEITGFKKEEVLGNFCKHIFKSKLCYTECPIALVIKSNKNIYDFESSITKSSEEIIPIKLNAAVLYNDNREPRGGIVTFRDISEMEKIRKDLEKETHFNGIVGVSKHMQEIFSLIKEITDSVAPVLISGESGTGKELIANAIQKTSMRRDKPFIKINCAVLPPQLLGSELFGHVKGAFTDAVKDRIGRFELADGGTVFLDEVAEMPQQTQIQLLRVLQEGTFERVGESETRTTNVRVIAATNINIEKALNEGKFREDLFYRLNVIPITVKPLRERLDDIIPLVHHFIHKFNLIYKKEIEDISDETLELLHSYNWPGNIRELENVLEFAYVRTKKNNIITAQQLPPVIKSKSVKNVDVEKNISVSFGASYLIKVLDKNKWNKSAAAKELGIGRTTLWRKLKEIGLE